jgi:DNA mismatch repair protein MutS2
MVGSPVRVVSQASAEALELPSLLTLYAELAATDLGHRRLLTLEPCSELEKIRHRHRLLADTGKLLQEGSLVPSHEESLSALLESLQSGDRAVSGAELMQLAGVLEVTRRLTERVRSSELEVPQLRSLVDLLPDGEPLRRRLIKSLDKRGRVRDDASPALARLRRQVHRIRGGLYKQLQETLTEHQEHFSESTVSLKDGRLTLLLQAGARGRLDGLVHGRSGTGQSLYFEPLTAVDSNNSLQETIGEEEAERHRILLELVAAALQELPLIEAHFAALGEVDLLQGVCRFAELSDSHVPEIAQQGELRMLAARHPLLDPSLASLRESALGQAGHLSTVVPLDLELDSQKRVLVVTGPNAGGKTVALKTVGLLALAAQCGLPIPARAGTRLPLTCWRTSPLLARGCCVSKRLGTSPAHKAWCCWTS